MSVPSISILIVNYKTPDLTTECLESVFKYPPGGDFEVIVVDNASSDGSVELIKERFPQIILIPSDRNLGFAGGNNLALKYAKKDICLLLNSDTLVHEEALINLQSFFHTHQSAGAVGGKNHNTDGSVQYSIRYFPRVLNMLAEAFYLHKFFSGPYITEREERDREYSYSHRAEWLSGSYLAIRSDLYKEINGLDEAFFMYSEDTDLCYRIKNARHEIWFCHNSVITHHGGGSSDGFKKLPIQLVSSKVLYSKLHFSSVRYRFYRFAITVWLINRFLTYLILSPFRQGCWELAKQRISALIEINSQK